VASTPVHKNCLECVVHVKKLKQELWLLQTGRAEASANILRDVGSNRLKIFKIAEITFNVTQGQWQ